LSQVVRQLAEFFPTEQFPNVLVGLGEPDDAAVFKLDDERALIKTTDFFTPIVDDPWTFGAIAAVNAMSDVYAMGGEVLFCLNIAGFPDSLGYDVIGQIFAGAAAKVREAGAAIVGGHTVVNPEPFFGLSVTGLIHPARVMRKGGAQVGDRLFLTKPLGTGMITTAAKQAGPGESAEERAARRLKGKPDLDPRDLDAAVLSMLLPNRAAAQAAQAAGVRCATDVTGFGLLGHAAEVAFAGGSAGVGLRIRAADVPALPGVDAYIAGRYLTRGSTRNPEHYGALVRFAESITPAQRTLLWEAETSGGLLLAVPAAAVETFLAACAGRKQAAWEIGEVVPGAGIEVV
jgi:selenide,water dikinase